MFKTILVPVDISQLDGARQALSHAKDIVKSRGGKIVLLTVIEEIPTYIAAEIPAEILTTADRKTHEELQAFATGEGIATEAETVVLHGHAARDILEYANQNKADMIVMSSHDPGFADYFLGSTAGHVVRHAHCSVLVVRNPPD